MNKLPFDILIHLTNYLEGKDLQNFRLTCRNWYNVSLIIMPQRCFKCYRRDPIYSSIRCSKKACESCINYRFYSIFLTASRKNLKHKKRLRIMFNTFLEYPQFLLTQPKLLIESYKELNCLLLMAQGDFEIYLTEQKRLYQKLNLVNDSIV